MNNLVLSILSHLKYITLISLISYQLNKVVTKEVQKLVQITELKINTK